MIRKDCPVCNQHLREILDKEGFVIDYWCNKCYISWDLEDLIIKKQNNLDNFMK